MYKRILATVFASGIILAGCASTGGTASTSPSSTAVVSEVSSSVSSETTTSETGGKDLSFMETAVENQYPNLEVVASLQNRMAIMPGDVFPVKVSVKNNGEESISFMKGSGTFTTPDALILDVPGLQPILPEDHLGLATTDLAFETLEPGDTLEYTLYVAAIKPAENFNALVQDLYQKDGTYVGDMNAEQLKEADPNLEEVSVGAYNGTVYFPYVLLNADDESVDPMDPPTGYAKAEFALTISQ